VELVDEGRTHHAAVGDGDETGGEESMEKRRSVRDGSGGGDDDDDDGRRGKRSVEDEFDRERAQGGGEEQGFG
jgi:hypothetical protein